MKTYISLDHARKIPHFRKCAVTLDTNPECQNMLDSKTGVIVVRKAAAIPKGAKRVTPLKENLKSLGWFALSLFSYTGIMGAVIYLLGRV